MSERCAVVTGGARNIGLAIALRLQRDGFRVIVLDLERPAVDSLVADSILVNLADVEATRAAAMRIVNTYPVRCLVNNVGIVHPSLFDDVLIADFDRLMHVNVRSALICTQVLVASMRRLGGGRIVMTTSRVTKGKEARTLYSASKGALEAMARTWSLELAKDAITVNCIAPGPIGTTAFWDNNNPASPGIQSFLKGIPLGRLGTPDDVANAASFFCDDRASFITGQTLFVCGGVTVG